MISVKPNSNTKHKKIIYALSALGITLLVAVIVLASFLGTRKENIQAKTCVTKACISAANAILQNMDLNVDPCEDFNLYSCGSYIKNMRIPDDASKYDVFDILRIRLAFSVADLLAEPNAENDINATKYAKNLYKSCLNETTSELVGEDNLKILVETTFGGWPLLGENNWNPSDFDPIQIQVLSRSYGLNQIVSVYIDEDPDDPKAAVLAISQPNWFFNKDYYTEANANEKAIIAAYKKYMFNFVKLMGSAFSDSKIQTDVEEVYELEKSLAELTLSAAERRNTTFKNMTIQQLINELPEFDWENYIINGMFKNIENITMDKSERILVEDMDYFTRALKVYKNVITSQPRVLKNLLIWTLVKDKTGLLPKRYKDARLDFDKIYTGTATAQARSYTCANYVLNGMEFAAGRIYVANYFSEGAKKAADQMIEFIRKEFDLILKNSEWMDDSSKFKAQDKLKYIESKIAYPDFIYDDAVMNKLYADYQFTDNDYFRNSFKLTQIHVKEDLKSLREEIDRTSWFTGPAVVNAFYSPGLNQICFPSGILQPPFYDADVPRYLNFGGIGSVIGHELTHGFDDNGRKYDKNGVFLPDDASGTWSNSTIVKYKEKAQCIENQYSNFYVKQVNLYVNGLQTLGENIADNGGVRQSYNAYQTWVKNNGEEPLLPGLNFTQNQLFFINYGQVWCGKLRDQSLLNRVLTDVHSPGEFRICGVTANMKEFADAFQCKSNTPNNPSNKCRVW